MRYGRKQLELMAQLAGVHAAIVVPSPLTESLCRRGVMAPASPASDGFIVLTAEGYRAIADALDTGAITRPLVERLDRTKRMVGRG